MDFFDRLEEHGKELPTILMNHSSSTSIHVFFKTPDQGLSLGLKGTSGNAWMKTSTVFW